MRIVGAVSLLPTAAVGMMCALPTIAVLVRSVQLAVKDVNATLASHDPEKMNRYFETRKKIYKKGDFIMLNNQNETFSTSAYDFNISLELSPEPEKEDVLVQKGFQHYRPTGRIWARQLSNDDVAKHFPTGKMISNWGTIIPVKAGCFLTMASPFVGELSVVDCGAFFHNFTRVNGEMPQTNEHVPSQSDVISQWKSRLQHFGRLYCKTATVHAKVARRDGVSETIVDGIIEARNSYCKGSFIVCDSNGKRFTLDPSSFAMLFDQARPKPALDRALEKDGFQLYTSAITVWACIITPRDIALSFPSSKFLGSFGGTVLVEAGDYLIMRSPAADEVFALPPAMFSANFEPKATGGQIVAQAEALAHWGSALRHDGQVYCRTASVHAKYAVNKGKLTDEKTAAFSLETGIKLKIIGNARGEHGHDDGEHQYDDAGQQAARHHGRPGTARPPAGSASSRDLITRMASTLCTAETESVNEQRPTSVRQSNREERLEVLLFGKDVELSRKDGRIAKLQDEVSRLDEEIASLQAADKRERSLIGKFKIGRV